MRDQATDEAFVGLATIEGDREIDRTVFQPALQIAAAADLQRQADLRMSFAKVREKARELVGRDGFERADGQGLFALLSRGADGNSRLVMQRQDLLGIGLHHVSRRRQRHTLAGAFEELHAELQFERLHLVAEARLRQVRFGCGPGQIAEPGDGEKGLQLAWVHSGFRAPELRISRWHSRWRDRVWPRWSRRCTKYVKS